MENHAESATEDVDARPLGLRFLRPTSPPLWLGVTVAVGLIAAETLVVVSLERLETNNPFGALFLVGVLVVSAGWGFGLALATTLVSAVVYMQFHLGDDGFVATETQDWLPLMAFLPVALLINVLVGQARLRAADAEHRRREAETSRLEHQALAEQQAALRRVATLVAQGVGAAELFSAVTDELAEQLDLPHSALLRFEHDGAAVLVAYYDDPPAPKPLGERYPLSDHGVAAQVYLTGQAARVNSQEITGVGAIRAKEMRLGAVVGVPIVVDSRVWGAAVVGSSLAEPLPADTETRVADFTELVATAISNTQTRADLAASRARIVAAADDARRRIERDLHDGAQQRLLSLGLDVRAAESALRSESNPIADRVTDIVEGLTNVSEELREISRGIHPAILSRGGLGPALKALARRSSIPVELDLGIEARLPEPVEVAAYYVAAEALTNAARHAQASHVKVSAEIDGTNLRLAFRDDGIGGADPTKGSGLTGLIDRVDAVGGQLTFSSLEGSGTSILVNVPVEGPDYG